MATPLSDQEIQSALQRLPNWSRNGKAIERIFQFPNFVDAMIFVNNIAQAAEEANHHPDITINYNKVTLQLISHDSGGVTSRDIKMAARINEVAGG
jgi:4a-hydroxytetrahydrobiopterin dehydratase